MKAMKSGRLCWAVASCALAVVALLFAIRGGIFNSWVGNDDAGRIPFLELPRIGRPLPPVTWERTDSLGAGLPKQLLVYEVAQVDMELDDAASLARLFGFASPISSKGDIYMASEHDRRLVLNADGTFSYVTDGRCGNHLCNRSTISRAPRGSEGLNNDSKPASPRWIDP